MLFCTFGDTMKQTGPILTQMQQQASTGNKSMAVLVDPDKTAEADWHMLVPLAESAGVDYLFVGGSLLVEDRLKACVNYYKGNTEIPVVLFPGSPAQIVPEADALLLLSLISGRNPELLIGQHVLAAPRLKQSGLEVISTGYMLVDGGSQTTVSYISNTTPLPHNKPDIAACTALAGSMLGLQTTYLDAGSGADKPISETMITAVKQEITGPLLVGGGLRTTRDVRNACNAGADIVVVGNVLEKDPLLIGDMAKAVHQCSRKSTTT